MRIRLLAGLAVAAALLGLTACRSSPEVAAYVGDETITEARVTQLIDELLAAQEAVAREKGEKVPQVQRADRNSVVHVLVRAKLCDRLRDKLGFQAEQPSLSAGTPELVVIDANYAACRKAIPIPAPIEPTEADLREVFDAGVRLGVFPPGSFEEQKDMLKSGGQLAEGLGQRKVLKEALRDAEVTVNPRYGAVEFPLLSWRQGSALSLKFGEPGPVVDAPRPATDAPTQ